MKNPTNTVSILFNNVPDQVICDTLERFKKDAADFGVDVERSAAAHEAGRVWMFARATGEDENYIKLSFLSAVMSCAAPSCDVHDLQSPKNAVIVLNPRRLH